MSDSRNVDSHIWFEPTFRGLSTYAKAAFFDLLSHPDMTPLGAMRVSPADVSDELRWREEDWRQALDDLVAAGMAEHDEDAGVVVLPMFMRWNPPMSPSDVKAWAQALDVLPQCALTRAAMRRAKGIAEGLTIAYAKALPKGFLIGEA